jgi:hypothetical protein
MSASLRACRAIGTKETREWRTDSAGLTGRRYVEEAEAAHADAPRRHLQRRVVALIERKDLRN